MADMKNPTPEQLKSYRLSLGLTQTEAGMFGDLVREIDQFLGENHANNIK